MSATDAARWLMGRADAYDADARFTDPVTTTFNEQPPTKLNAAMRRVIANELRDCARDMEARRDRTEKVAG